MRFQRLGVHGRLRFWHVEGRAPEFLSFHPKKRLTVLKHAYRRRAQDDFYQP